MAKPTKKAQKPESTEGRGGAARAVFVLTRLVPPSTSTTYALSPARTTRTSAPNSVTLWTTDRYLDCRPAYSY